MSCTQHPLVVDEGSSTEVRSSYSQTDLPGPGSCRGHLTSNNPGVERRLTTHWGDTWRKHRVRPPVCSLDYLCGLWQHRAGLELLLCDPGSVPTLSGVANPPFFSDKGKLSHFIICRDVSQLYFYSLKGSLHRFSMCLCVNRSPVIILRTLKNDIKPRVWTSKDPSGSRYRVIERKHNSPEHNMCTENLNCLKWCHWVAELHCG